MKQQQTVTDLWSDRGWGLRDRVQIKSDSGAWARQDEILTAHAMVQSFVDSFAPAELRFRVTFDPKVTTAGTDFETRQIVVSPKPALDTALSAMQAATILTAMATHEASHVRYGTETASAVRDRWGTRPEPDRLSNILDDARIERRYVEEFPGYDGIFEPALEYVVKPSLDPVSGLFTPDPADPLNVACGAVRYDRFVDWNGLEDERAWWSAWGARYTADDTVELHLAGVAEGLAHIKQQHAKNPPRPGQRSALDPGLPTIHDNAPETERRKAQQVVDAGDTIQQVADSARLRSIMGHIAHASRKASLPVRESSSAAAVIRNAFLRGRTGVTGIERPVARGRCDSKSLARVALDDYRLFHRRHAPDPGKFNVWVLVDCSGSMHSNDRMGGTPIAKMAGVAKALARASRGAPNIRMSVRGWTDATMNAPWAASFGVYEAWRTGQDVSEVDRLCAIRPSGTPDSLVMAWAREAIRRDARPGEQPVIVMCSDGAGDYRGLAEEVREARRSGVVVHGVAIGHVDLERVYGPRDWVKWPGSIEGIAGPMSKMLLRTITRGLVR